MSHGTALVTPAAPLAVGDQLTARIDWTGVQITLSRTASAQWRVTALDCYARPIYNPIAFGSEQDARSYARSVTQEMRQIARSGGLTTSPVSTLVNGRQLVTA